MASGGVEKQIEKLRAKVDSGSFYEAQQIFKTVYHRYRSRKQLQDAYQLLEEGAVMQFDRDQVTCGLELALLLLDAYSTDNVPPDSAAVQRVLRILDSMKPSKSPTSEPSTSSEPDPPDTGPLSAAASQIATAAIKWSRKAPSSDQGTSVAGSSGDRVAGRGSDATALLHKEYAHWLTERIGPGSLGTAVPHYARGDDVEGLVKAVQAAAADAPGQERDLFLVRAVLQVLAASPSEGLTQALAQVRQLVSLFLRDAGHQTAPANGTDPATKPVLQNFLDLLLQALERKSLQLEQIAQQVYRPVLDQDAELGQLLGRIERTHLVVPSGPGLQSLLQGLLAGGL